MEFRDQIINVFSGECKIQGYYGKYMKKLLSYQKQNLK